MNAIPVIARELRAESRHGFNYWLRVIGASAMVVCLMVIWNAEQNPSQLGERLFTRLNAILFVSIWVFVPILTSDCISRERREGTLGLLFLTPLTARGIIAGKSVIHGLRALTLLLAVLPPIMLPIVLGGTTWIDVLTASAFDLASICLALAAGMLASSIAKEWVRAVLLASLFSMFFLAVFGDLVLLAQRSFYANPKAALAPAPAPPSSVVFVNGQPIWVGSSPRPNFVSPSGFVSFPGRGSYEPPRNFFTEIFCATTSLNSLWSHDLSKRIPTAPKEWLKTVGTLFLVGPTVLLGVAMIAGRQVKRIWKEEPPTRQQLWVLKTFCTPRVGVSIFRRRMSKTLDQNPIAWLQQYSWSARLTKWGWCFVIILIEGSLLSGNNPWSDFVRSQRFLMIGLLLGMAFSAAGSFRGERQNGALELLLVAPLSAEQIILGRLLGIWKQFFLAGITLLIAWTSFMSLSWSHYAYDYRWFLIFTFLTLPVIGLYFSLRMKNFLVGWLCAASVGIGIPFVLAAFSRTLAFYLTGGFRPGSQDVSLAILYELAVGVVFFVLLRMNLEKRKFALS